MADPKSIAGPSHNLSTGSLGGEVGLKVRGLANFAAATVAGVLGPLAASASGASRLSVFLGRTAAGAFAGRALV